MMTIMVNVYCLLSVMMLHHFLPSCTQIGITLNDVTSFPTKKHIRPSVQHCKNEQNLAPKLITGLFISLMQTSGNSHLTATLTHINLSLPPYLGQLND